MKWAALTKVMTRLGLFIPASLAIPAFPEIGYMVIS
jgi:hypothetical protein